MSLFQILVLNVVIQLIRLVFVHEFLVFVEDKLLDFLDAYWDRDLQRVPCTATY